MIKTDRLTLREVCDEDFDAVYAYASDPEVVTFMTWGPSTPEETRGFLARAQALAAAVPRVGYELAVVRRSDGRLLGGVGLNRDQAGSSRAMLGYCYHRDAWGYGYATEAARAVLRFGFEELGLHRVWAGCDPENLGSVRVLTKLGMTQEARLRQDSLVQGEWRDALIFGILRDEWRALTDRSDH